MKKLFCLAVLFLSLSTFFHTAYAEPSALENAISQLWLSGPDEKIATILTRYANNSEKDFSEKAAFHLTCLKLMTGEQKNITEVLNDLEKSAKTANQKDLVRSLRSQLQPKEELMPEGMSKVITLDLKEVPAVDVLKLIARQTSLNIAIHRRIAGKIELHLEKVTAKQAIDSICKSYDMDYRVKDNIVSVFPRGMGEKLNNMEPIALPSGFKKKISLNFSNTDVRTIIQIMAKSSGENIIIHNRVRGKTSLTLTDVTIEQALNALCTAADLQYENNDNIFIVLPASSRKTTYIKKRIELSFLSPEAARKILLSAAGKSPEILIGTSENSVYLEGNPKDLEKYETLLLAQDKKGKTQKISVKIWKLESESKLSSKEFSELNESGKKEVAKLLSAPSLISLPGTECKIKVESENDENNDQKKDFFSYSFSCIFHETEVPDRIRLISNVKVYGVTFRNGQKNQIKQEFSPTLEIQRNKWAVLPLSEDKERIYLELQISNFVK